ncbi:MAG: phage terminase small subunit-related protein [Deltaproteobacteria bacterium]|nr:phage terminase small subunit-related protein [Deltaproteobacteria bacterium]
MMKKEARLQAEKMFVNAKGKITNREIAKTLNVNALTVGRWKREEEWDSILKAREQAAIKEDRAGSVRKKDARDKAVRLYTDAGGNITNKELAIKVGVSPATISKWKEVDAWISNIQLQPLTVQESPVAQEEPGFDLNEMASPEQIIRINKKIDVFLAREHLLASEILDLADAKSALLESVETYLAIVRDLTAMKLSR